jgi:hypothetical protein
MYEGKLMLDFIGELVFSGTRSLHARLDLRQPSEVLLAYFVSLLQGLLQEKLENYRRSISSGTLQMHKLLKPEHQKVGYARHLSSITAKCNKSNGGWLHGLWRRLEQYGLRRDDAANVYMQDGDELYLSDDPEKLHNVLQRAAHSSQTMPAVRAGAGEGRDRAITEEAADGRPRNDAVEVTNVLVTLAAGPESSTTPAPLEAPEQALPSRAPPSTCDAIPATVRSVLQEAPPAVARAASDGDVEPLQRPSTRRNTSRRGKAASKGK